MAKTFASKVDYHILNSLVGGYPREEEMPFRVYDRVIQNASWHGRVGFKASSMLWANTQIGRVVTFVVIP